MTKIQTIDVQYFDPPLDEVLEDAKHGAHTHFELVTVTITDSDGISGTGYTYTGGKGGRSIETMINHDLVPFLMGQDTQDIDALYDGMQWHVHYVARGGIASFAISAVDIALWDLRGKRTKTSLVQMAGGAHVRCRAYRGGIDLGYDLPRLLQSMDEYMEAGFDAVKIKIGQPELTQDIERIRAVRTHIGDQRTFMVMPITPLVLNRRSPRQKCSKIKIFTGLRNLPFPMIIRAMPASPQQHLFHWQWGKTCILSMNLATPLNTAIWGLFNQMHQIAVV